MNSFCNTVFAIVMQIKLVVVLLGTGIGQKKSGFLDGISTTMLIGRYFN